MLASLIAALLVAPPAVASPSPPREPAAAPAPARLQRGYLRAEGLPRAELVDALALRVPHLAFEPFEAAAGVAVGDGAAFVELRPVSSTPGGLAEAFTLTIVVSDGRAFDRQVQTTGDAREDVRLLASTVANLLLAIEAGTVKADRGDVPLPTPEPRPQPDPPPARKDECPAVPACPVAPEGERFARARTPPVIELGPSLVLLSITGLGKPAAADRFAGFGASVGVHARLRRGALVGVSARTAGRGEPAGTRLVRQRVALGAGYELRREGWALEASLWGTVEPWWLVGAPIEPAPRPQWGLVVRLAPSLHRDQLLGGRLRLSLGAVIELGASAELGPAGARIGLVTVTEGDTVRSHLRVGGLELSTGLAATLWFGLPRASARPDAATRRTTGRTTGRAPS